MLKHMLAVLMDGIKDCDMIMNYYDDSITNGMVEQANWFKDHAKARIDWIIKDYDYIAQNAGLMEKAKSGDEIADALVAHLNWQVAEMKKRYAAM